MISEQEHDAAVQLGEEMYRTLPHPIAVRYNSVARLVEVDLNWGYSITFPPERAQDLASATDEQLLHVEVAGVWGIYFPEIDADLWVPHLVSGRFGNDRWEEAWHRAQMREGQMHVSPESNISEAA
jgi:hypothetical protein